MTEESHKDKNAAGQDAPATDEMDEVIKMKDSVCVGPFQAEVLKGRVARAPAHDTHIMVAPIRHAEVEMGKHTHYPKDYKCCMHTPCSWLVACKF